MMFFVISRTIKVTVSVVSLSLWLASAENPWDTLDYSGHPKEPHPIIVYRVQCSNATIQLTVMQNLTAWYLWFVGPVWDVKFSGADRVVTCGDDGTIRIWDSWSSHCIAVLSGHLDAVLSISLRQITGLCRFLNNLRLVMHTGKSHLNNQ